MQHGKRDSFSKEWSGSEKNRLCYDWHRLHQLGPAYRYHFRVGVGSGVAAIGLSSLCSAIDSFLYSSSRFFAMYFVQQLLSLCLFQSVVFFVASQHFFQCLDLLCNWLRFTRIWTGIQHFQTYFQNVDVFQGSLCFALNNQEIWSSILHFELIWPASAWNQSLYTMAFQHFVWVWTVQAGRQTWHN